MSENPAPRPAVTGFECTDLDKLRLAAQVILEAASGSDLISDPLEVEAGILKDRVEFMLLLPAGLDGELPWHGHDDELPWHGHDDAPPPPRPRPETPGS
jgi:hypothetical protein